MVSVKPWHRSYTGKPGKQIDAEYMARAALTPTVTRCLYCPWTHEGPAADGRAAYQQHRATHRELAPPKPFPCCDGCQSRGACRRRRVCGRRVRDRRSQAEAA